MLGTSVRRACARLLGLGFALCALALVSPHPASAAGNPDAESWVRSQVLAGRSADLNNFHGADRTLSAGFLADLLAGPTAAQIPRHGVVIANSDVVGDVDLHNAEVLPEVNIMQSRVHGAFDASGSHFHRQLRLQADFEDTAFFFSARADLGIDLRDAKFKKGVDFSDAIVSSVFDASRVQFSGASEPATGTSAYEFQRMVVTGSAFFDNAVFDWPAHFALAHFGSLQASGVQFGKRVLTDETDSDYSNTNFTEVTVDQDALLSGSWSPTGLAFTGATIGRTFLAADVRVATARSNWTG